MNKRLNNLRYRTEWVLAQKLQQSRPLCVDVELTTYCNLKCPFCYHAGTPPFTRQHMPLNYAVKALTEASRLGVPSIKLNYRGEPTLYPFFREVCELAERLSDGYTLQERITNTNMQFFGKNRADILKGLLAQTKVKISMDSLNAATYKKHRVGGDYNALIENINDLYFHPDRRKDHEIVLQFVKTEHNKHEDFTTARQLWPTVGISVRDMVDGRNTISTQPCDNTDRQPCHQPFARLMVLADGNYQVCCPNYTADPLLSVGHIDTDTIEAAFNGLEARTIRDKIRSGEIFDYSPCKNCSSFESYEGWKPNWKA